MVAPYMLYVPVGIAILAIFIPMVTMAVNDWIQYLFFVPSFPFEVILVSIFSPDMKENLFTVDVGFCWFALIFICPLYLLLHIYFEAIIPETYGVNSSLCFCLDKLRKNPELESINEEADSQDDVFNDSTQMDSEFGDDCLIDDESKDLMTNDTRIERESEARRAFDTKDPIQLRNMTMKFGDFKAVDNLSLSIKKSEIIAVLGHNGAGKTTAIYMLTGMLMPTEGDAILNGNSIIKQTCAVRRQLGLCQQHDVLFDTISVEEHLRLAMRIRTNEVNEEKEEKTIGEIMQEVMLTEHKEKLACELSGGMKRKLSLGMALIGGT